MESGEREYYVHYSGWNARYDEWISENRVAARLADGSNERTRPSTAKVDQLSDLVNPYSVWGITLYTAYGNGET